MSTIIAPYWFTAGGVFSPLDLSPALWVDPSDASTVTISGSSGAYIGADGLELAGTTTNAALAPYVAAYEITTDIDIIAKVTSTDWTPIATRGILHRGGVSTSRAYGFNVLTTGALSITWVDAGIVQQQADSTVATGLTDGSTKWVRVTLDVDNGSGAYEAKFYLSDDGTAWTQLGATVTGGSTTSIRSLSTVPMMVGARNLGAADPFNGTIHRAIVKNGIDGTTVFDADFESATPYVSAFTESALGAPVYVVSSTATSSTANYAYVGPNGLEVPAGVNYATAADLAAYDITGDIDIIVKATATTWAPTDMANDADLICRSGGTPYSLQIASASGSGTGKLRLVWYQGGGAKVALSTVGTGFSAASTNWVRATLDVDNGAGGYDAKFWTSSDGVSWTQLGSTVTVGSTTSIDAGATAIIVGKITTSAGVFRGTIHRAIIKNGIDGTTVFDANFETAPDYAASFVESSSNAATVTITATNTPANAAGALVSQIDDKSGNARHLTQGIAANMPKYWNGRNGFNCLVFVTDDSMASTLFTPSATSEVFLVRESADTSQIVLNGTAGVHAWWIATSGSASATVQQGSTLTGLFANGSSVSTATRGSIYTGTVGAKVLHATGDISAWPSVGINGWQLAFQDDARIGELVLVDSTLAAGDVTAMDSYAMTKWGIS
jgi:hypothetical protein